MIKEPLILLPGLGADGRMFSSLRAHLPHVETPGWIKPRWHESVGDYAKRLAPEIDPGRPFFIGGASFGGVAAIEVAACLPNVMACFLIGSCRSITTQPWRLRCLRPITPFITILPAVSPLLVRALGTSLRPATRGVLTQLAHANPQFLRWAAGAILRWKPSPETARVPICQIHGERDRIFPLASADADVIIPDAGHLVPITHAAEVSQALREQMEAFHATGAFKRSTRLH